MSTVRPEFHPTLPELLRPRLRAMAPGRRRAVIGAVAVAVIAIVVAIAASGTSTSSAVVRKPIAFNLVYTGALHRVAPHRGELLRLEGGGPRPVSFTVARFALPPYRGVPDGQLPLIASQLEQRMAGADPTYVFRGDGRARINNNPGYQIVFQVRHAGQLIYGRRVLLYDGTQAHPTEAVDLMLLNPRSAAVPNAASVGGNGALKTPLRSFRFGTSRP